MDELHCLGVVYICGNNIDKDIEEGVQILTTCADKGHIKSIIILGDCYGSALDEDIPIKRKYYLMGCEQNDALCFKKLGDTYDGTSKDDEWSAQVELYEKSFELGNKDVIFGLAVLYCMKQGSDNIDKAMEYLEEGCLANDPYCLCALGSFFYDGDICEKDVDRAFELYKKACELNHGEAFSLLGGLYVEKYDYIKAITHLSHLIFTTNSSK